MTVDFSQILFYIGTTDKTFPQSGKHDFFKHIPQRSANTFKDIQNQHLNTVKSRLIRVFKRNYDFLTFLGITEILSSIRFVIRGKSERKVPVSSRLEISEKISVTNFAFSDAEDKNSK